VVFGESAGAVAGLFGKATAKITDDLEVFLAFYDYPAEHWIHLRTTNPIESTFATVRHRTKITRGPALDSSYERTSYVRLCRSTLR
jgi:transposase-like protein